MSHQSRARVTSRLETRKDIENILDEMIGRHCLEWSLLGNKFDEKLRSSFRLTVFINVMFDQQRTYLQCSKPSSEALSRLLPPEALFRAIIYLLQIVSEAAQQSDANPEQSWGQRKVVARTLVSGLRALWLQKYTLSREEKTQLRCMFQRFLREDTYGDAQSGGLDDEIDHFITRKLLPMMVEYLSRLATELSKPACGEVQLSDYSIGLYPLECRPDELSSTVVKALTRLDSGVVLYWTGFWTIFDIIWNIEAALIQLCANSQKHQNNRFQEDFDQLHETREKVLRAILDPSRIELNDPHRLSSSAEYSSLEEALSDVVKYLNFRQEDLRDCNREVSDLSHKLERSVESWCKSVSPTGQAGSSSLDPQRATYVLPCPEVHPISYSNLKDLIEHDPGRTGLKHLENNATLFGVNIRCPHCENENWVKRARQIEPLHYISTEMEKVVQASTRRGSKNISDELEEVDLIRMISPSPSTQFSSSSHSTGSFDIPTAERSDINRSKENSFPPKRSHKKAPPSYSFSADGRSLFLWARDTDSIVFYNIGSRNVSKFPAANVYLAAGGAESYAVVSKIGNDESLNIYQMSDGMPIASVTLDGPVESIALSRNDEFVAWGTAHKAMVYSISSRKQWHHELPPAADITSKCQRVWFSTDSTKVVAATRNMNGDVHTYVGECTNPTPIYNIPHINIPPGMLKDFGVSSILYDNKFGCACTTAFTSGTPSALFLLRGSSCKVVRLNKKDLGTQIQCATSPPNPENPEFILINGENKVFSVRILSGGGWDMKKVGRLARDSIFTREEMTAITMPNQDTIYAFWIQGKDRMLATISGGEKSTRDLSKLLPI